MHNCGSSPITDAPLRLYYQGGQQDEVLVSLSSQQTDIIDLTWNTPTAPSSGDLVVGGEMAGDPESDE